MRRRLVVIATDPADVVRYAGGWLFDRALAGWDVRVLTDVRADTRPLRILGARPFDLESALAAPVRGPRPDAFGVSAELYATDPRVRDLVRDGLDWGVSDCRLWSEHWCGMDGEDTERHRLSAAARAFKTHALLAAAAPLSDAVPTESFRRAGALHPSPAG
ncbi:hypothetical protein [Actinocorallia longicatena]|uniref:Uncharacterized protein n=1 Tax=Actinocorallia longicatena TaxID=111803 RepID=A0ABP6Q543_9ACTN